MFVFCWRGRRRDMFSLHSWFFVPMIFGLQTNIKKKTFILVIQFRKRNTEMFWKNTLTRNIHRSMTNTTNGKYNHNDKWNDVVIFDDISIIFAIFSDVFVIHLSAYQQSIVDPKICIFAMNSIHIFQFSFISFVVTQHLLSNRNVHEIRNEIDVDQSLRQRHFCRKARLACCANNFEIFDSSILINADLIWDIKIRV